ncbi:MAG: hypothetical protein AABX53_01950 [Nanoarchaeota archaeon]
MGIPADFLNPCDRTSIRIRYDTGCSVELGALSEGELLVIPPGPQEDSYLLARFRQCDGRGTIIASAVASVIANYKGDELPTPEMWNGTRTIRHTVERVYVGRAAFNFLEQDPKVKPIVEHLARGHEDLLRRLEVERQKLYMGAETL